MLEHEKKSRTRERSSRLGRISNTSNNAFNLPPNSFWTNIKSPHAEVLFHQPAHSFARYGSLDSNCVGFSHRFRSCAFRSPRPSSFAGQPSAFCTRTDSLRSRLSPRFTIQLTLSNAQATHRANHNVFRHRRQSIPTTLPGNWSSLGCYTYVALILHFPSRFFSRRSSPPPSCSLHHFLLLLELIELKLTPVVHLPFAI